MERPLLIRLIGFVVIATIGAVIKNNKEKQNNKSLSKLKRKELDLPNMNLPKSEINKDDKSNMEQIKLVDNKQDIRLIDTYNHPNFYTNFWQFTLLGGFWLLFGVCAPYLFIDDLSITNCLIVTVINLLFAIVFWYSIKRNKNKVLINLFSNRLSFTKASGELIFDLPFNKINTIQLEVESNSGNIHPDEYIILKIDPEFVGTYIEPVLSKDNSLPLSEIFKIKYTDYGQELTGINNTNIKTELFNLFFE